MKILADSGNVLFKNVYQHAVMDNEQTKGQLVLRESDDGISCQFQFIQMTSMQEMMHKVGKNAPGAAKVAKGYAKRLGATAALGTFKVLFSKSTVRVPVGQYTKNFGAEDIAIGEQVMCKAANNNYGIEEKFRHTEFCMFRPNGGDNHLVMRLFVVGDSWDKISMGYFDVIRQAGFFAESIHKNFAMKLCEFIKVTKIQNAEDAVKIFAESVKKNTISM